MRKSFLILLSLVVLAPVIATTFGTDVGERTEELRNFVTDFLADFQFELASLSIAAVAAVGLQMGLKKYSKLADDRSVNVVTITIFVAMFLMVYSSGLYNYFIPFIGYLVITGIGIILFSIYQGLHENKVEPLDKIVGAGGCFFLAWFAILAGLPEAAILLGIIGFVMLLMALKGMRDLVGASRGKGGKGSRWRRGRGGDDPFAGDDVPGKPPVIKDAADFKAKEAAVKLKLRGLAGDLRNAEAELTKILAELDPRP